VIELKNIFFVNPDRFVTRQMGNEMVLVPLTNNVADMTSVLTLNEVGGDILKALEQPTSGNDVVEQLFLLYDVNKKVLEKDVKAFLEEALEKNVIEQIG
jgi:hypothetical protein